MRPVLVYGDPRVCEALAALRALHSLFEQTAEGMTLDGQRMARLVALMGIVIDRVDGEVHDYMKRKGDWPGIQQKTETEIWGDRAPGRG